MSYKRKRRQWIYAKYYTENSWDFGIGFTFAAIGRGIPGIATIRPASFSIMFGPHTWEWEQAGNCEVCTN